MTLIFHAFDEQLETVAPAEQKLQTDYYSSKKKKKSGRNIFFSLQQELILALAEDPNWSRNI